MNRRPRSLGAQLLLAVLAAMAAAALAFGVCFTLGGVLLDHTVYGDSFMGKMADRQFSQLQEFVQEEEISEENLQQLNVWCSRGDKVYLTVYRDEELLYVSPQAKAHSRHSKPEQGGGVAALEDPDREYALQLSDGTEVRAFLYYYSGDAFFYWMLFFSGALAFVVFSVCFIALVHYKLRYIHLLKSELDILAGGDLTYPVTVKGSDELAVLAEGIDAMRRSILTHQQAEDQIRSANSQLVTNMSHDLRTPLTSLLAYLELIERGKYDSPEQLNHFVRRALDQTLRIKSMADKLFEYFLVYSSEWDPVKMEEVDAEETLRQIWGEYEFSLENQGYSVESGFEPLEGRLRMNMDLMQRMFDNLYSNLLKYADPASPVTFSCGREGDMAKLTLVNRISASSRERESTNIGLGTCSRIMRYHGGSFETEQADGRYTVCLRFPLCR